MNNDLLEMVRELKRSGLSDEAISEKLSNEYAKEDIDKYLELLKNMKLEPENNINGYENKKSSNKQSKKKWVLIFAVIVISVAVSFYPVAMKQLKSQEVSRLDKTLRDIYDVDKSYDAGTVTECRKREPTNFGDVTGTYTCHIVSAKVYYPRVTISKEQAYDRESRVTYDTEKEKLTYVNSEGGPLGEYIQLGMPIRQPGGGNPYRVDANLGLTGANHVITSGFSSFQADSATNTINGKWRWSSEYSWLGSIGNGAKLMDSINEKIIADLPPVDGALSPTEALVNNTAPLVVYYSLRYCHSPSVIGLDKLCILPN